MSLCFDWKNYTQWWVTATPEAYSIGKVEDHWMGLVEEHRGFEDGNLHPEELAMKDFWCASTSRHQILNLRSATLAGLMEDVELAGLQY